jgi:UrcA family protein
LAALATGAHPAGAAERSRVTYADLDLTSPRGAHLMLGRIDQAAVAVCGGGRASLREVNQAVRRTACWRDALDDAVASLDAPQVTQAWRRVLGNAASTEDPRRAASVRQR